MKRRMKEDKVESREEREERIIIFFQFFCARSLIGLEGVDAGDLRREKIESTIKIASN